MKLLNIVKYSSGIIAILLVPVMLLIYLMENPRYKDSVIKLTAMKEVKRYSDGISCQIRVAPKYENFEIFGSESNLMIGKAMKEFLSNKEIDSYLCIDVSKIKTYGKFIDILSICLIERVPTFFYYDDKIWVSQTDRDDSAPAIIYID